MNRQQNSLLTLIELAQRQLDDAALALKRAAQKHQQAQQQLATLQQYRHDYVERLQQSSQTGLSLPNYHNFRQFITTLDDAITRQNTVLSQCSEQIDKNRGVWMRKKQQLQSYETLQKRHIRQQQRLEQRQEQRNNDELALQQRRRHSQPL